VRLDRCPGGNERFIRQARDARAAEECQPAGAIRSCVDSDTEEGREAVGVHSGCGRHVHQHTQQLSRTPDWPVGLVAQPFLLASRFYDLVTKL
jgi:hypothetical protein